MKVEPEHMTFEQALSALEAAVARLEAGNLPLEQAVALYEEGMRLAKICGERLDAAELRITRLATGEDGQIQETPMGMGERQ
jgi:exodeoxyribonuclease VII small subunit